MYYTIHFPSIRPRVGSVSRPIAFRFSPRIKCRTANRIVYSWPTNEERRSNFRGFYGPSKYSSSSRTLNNLLIHFYWHTYVIFLSYLSIRIYSYFHLHSEFLLSLHRLFQFHITRWPKTRNAAGYIQRSRSVSNFSFGRASRMAVLVHLCKRRRFK